jgi:alcohol dehydrogenase (cytochrome c)
MRLMALVGVSFLASTALLASSGQQTTNPLAADPEARIAGGRLFQQSCATCHGDPSRAPVLTAGVLARGSQDSQIFQNIRSGIAGTQMVPFASLSTEQIWQLVSYIRGSATAAPATAAGLCATCPQVTSERLRRSNTEPHNWMTYWGDYAGTHYSALTEVTTTNVPRLQAQWAMQFPGSTILEATPLVVDGVMYTSGLPGTVVAIDAATGRQIWRYQRPQKVRNPDEINPFNRGVAVLGNRVFFGTLDAALVALDVTTGLPLWEVQLADTMLGYSLTSAPLIVKDKVLAGITGGEFGPPGFLDAYDPETGKRLWRFHSIPGPGEFGHDTWAGDSWKLGGSPMWLTGSYDPELNLLYWTVGNPTPQMDRSARAGDNLFSDSVVALDPDTGERKWHYQFTPNDGHDWDSNQDVILVDRMWRGRMRKLLLHADRNGLFYVLDRATGEFLSGTPFVYQNWNTGFDAKGRPIAAPGSNSSPEGSFYVFPSIGGGTNFQAPSYSPITGWLYLEYAESGRRYVSAPEAYQPGKQYIGRGADAAGGPKPGEPTRSAGIKALDPDSGKTIWDFKISLGSLTNGVLATAGGVVFAATREGNLIALDANTGKSLWRFQTGAAMAASPMSYAVGGKQYVAVSAGNVLYSFALPN